jgi:hypothetical protein
VLRGAPHAEDHRADGCNHKEPAFDNLNAVNEFLEDNRPISEALRGEIPDDVH